MVPKGFFRVSFWVSFRVSSVFLYRFFKVSLVRVGMVGTVGVVRKVAIYTVPIQPM